VVQRRILAALFGGPVNGGLPAGELKARVGGDRSNLRRAIRRLEGRGLVEQHADGGERRVRLTLRGASRAMLEAMLRAMPLPAEPEGDPLAEEVEEPKARWEETARALRLERERAREEARLRALEGPFWYGWAPRLARRRHPGPTQRTVLVVLHEFAEPLDSGLPIPAVKAIVRETLGTDRSNTHRALRSLVFSRGEVEVSEDGERVRLSERTALSCSPLYPIPPEEVDGRRAREIIAMHEGPPGVVP
jgi:DNA-binding MarR family transcriptional regulator